MNTLGKIAGAPFALLGAIVGFAWSWFEPGFSVGYLGPERAKRVAASRLEAAEFRCKASEYEVEAAQRELNAARGWGP